MVGEPACGRGCYPTTVRLRAKGKAAHEKAENQPVRRSTGRTANVLALNAYLWATELKVVDVSLLITFRIFFLPLIHHPGNAHTAPREAF